MLLNNSLTRIRCSGVNLLNFINQCSCQGINLVDLKRIDSRTLEFFINDSDYKILKSLDLRNYQISVVDIGGIKKLLRTLYRRMGLIIGGVIAIIIIILMNNKYVSLKIFGNENIDKIQIEKAIDEFGVKKYSKMDFDTKELELYLTNKFNLSFVSIITKGNSIVLNLKEELPKISSDFQPIISPYNMIVTDFKLFKGTSNIKIGDIIFKGDTIAYPYEIIDNKRIDVNPCLEIKGDVYFSDKYDFKINEEKLVRTNNYKIINSQVSLGNLKLFNTSNEHEFKYYEIEEKKDLITKYFLPLEIKKIIAYELTKEEILHDFENEKEEIIHNLKENILKKIPKHLAIDNEEIIISPTNYGNIVTIYLKSSVYLKYNLN